MTLSRKFALLPLCLLALLLALSIGCKKGDPIMSPYEQSVDNPALTLDKMKACIKEAGIRRGWAVKDLNAAEPVAEVPAKGKGKAPAPARTPARTSGQAQATLLIRTHTVVVDIFYTTKDFKITYRDSINMEYNGTTIHDNYNKWVKTLADDIRIRAVSM